MDASLYWKNPSAYFGSGDFYYTFIISVYVGILRFVFPLCAILPAGMQYAEDQNSRFLIPSLHRQSPQRYIVNRILSAILLSALMVIIAMAFTTALYFIMCPVEYQEDSFQVLAMESAYAWRASPQYFYVFILEATGRLILSAAFWSLIALAFSSAWPNKTFIFVGTLVFAYSLEALTTKFGLQDWAVSFLQAPDLDTETSLWIPFAKQLVYLLAAAGMCYIGLQCALSARWKRVLQCIQGRVFHAFDHIAPPQHMWMPQRLTATFGGRLWVDFRAFCCPMAILCTLIVATLCVALCPILSRIKYSVGELLLGVFGGLAWVDPQIDFYGIGRWILLLFPPMTGVAYCLDRELASRKLLTVYRYGDIRTWWRSKAIACLLYSLLTVCLMFLWASIIGWLSGSHGLEIYVVDADGFAVEGKGIISTMFLQFCLQVIMLTQIQVVFHAVFHDMKAGIIAYLIPITAQLLACSNIETTRNIWAPINWGMILRTNLFCHNGYMMNNGEWMNLCAIEPFKAITAQILGIIILFSFHMVFVPLTEQKRNG